MYTTKQCLFTSVIAFLFLVRVCGQCYYMMKQQKQSQKQQQQIQNFKQQIQQQMQKLKEVKNNIFQF